jgi:hypothetical protein
MKAERMYQELIDLAEKLGIEVAEQNFRATGVHAVSGLCKVKGKSLFLIDKFKKLPKKIEILSEFLADMPCGDIYILPAVREHLNKYREADSLFNRQNNPKEDKSDD